MFEPFTQFGAWSHVFEPTINVSCVLADATGPYSIYENPHANPCAGLVIGSLGPYLHVTILL
jgi:hypothetical protein